MRYLLDTNVVSEAIRPRPDSKVLSWLTQHIAAAGLSAISVGEIWKGIESLPEGKRRNEYVKWFQELETEFQDRVFPIDAAVMKTWGSYCAELKARGVRPASFDSLIAATALHHGVTLVTRNDGDFADVPVLNPWK